MARVIASPPALSDRQYAEGVREQGRRLGSRSLAPQDLAREAEQARNADIASLYTAEGRTTRHLEASAPGGGAQLAGGVELLAKGEKALVEVTDGWYSMRAVCDAGLTAQVRRGRIAQGTKLHVWGAELLGMSEGCAPLEVMEALPAAQLCASSPCVLRCVWWMAGDRGNHSAAAHQWHPSGALAHNDGTASGAVLPRLAALRARGGWCASLRRRRRAARLRAGGHAACLAALAGVMCSVPHRFIASVERRVQSRVVRRTRPAQSGSIRSAARCAAMRSFRNSAPSSRGEQPRSHAWRVLKRARATQREQRQEDAALAKRRRGRARPGQRDAWDSSCLDGEQLLASLNTASDRDALFRR